MEHKNGKDWRRLHNEELYDLYSTPAVIIRVIFSQLQRWLPHILHRHHTEIFYENFNGR